MEKSERRWVLWAAICLLVITTIPYLTGYWSQGTGWVFNGFVFGVEDGNSYIAKMLMGTNGAWLFETPYTAYAQHGMFALFPFLLLGKLAAGTWPHTELVAIFQIFRWCAGILAVLATYDFVALFISKVNTRRLVTILIWVGGGLGWLTLTGLKSLWAGRLPLEFYSPETFGFLELFGLPHLLMARALLLWGFCQLMRGGQDPVRAAMKCGLLWLAAGIFQPLVIVTAWMALSALILAQGIANFRKPMGQYLLEWFKISFQKYFWAVVLSSPLLLYNLISFEVDPSLNAWKSQNIILSPPFGDYLLAFGLMLPLVVYAVWKGALKDRLLLLPLAWLAIFPLMAYFPYPLQRRLPEGIWVCICILAAVGLDHLSTKTARMIRPGLVVISLFSSFLVFSGAQITSMSPEFPLFHPADEITLLESVQNLVHSGDVVLASFNTSNNLPAWLPVRTLTGHGPESLNLTEITPRIESFYSLDATDAMRIELIKEFNVKYIFYGPSEQELGDWDPETCDFLIHISDVGDYSWYQVNLAGNR